MDERKISQDQTTLCMPIIACIYKLKILPGKSYYSRADGTDVLSPALLQAMAQCKVAERLGICTAKVPVRDIDELHSFDLSC